MNNINNGFLSCVFEFSPNNDLIELSSNQDTEESWKDLTFTIREKEKMDNGFWSLTCKVNFKNQIVGQ